MDVFPSVTPLSRLIRFNAGLEFLKVNAEGSMPVPSELVALTSTAPSAGCSTVRTYAFVESMNRLKMTRSLSN